MSQSKVTIAILAGGESRRMGVDKSFVLFRGRPMIEIVVERVAGLGNELIIITNKPADYSHLGLPTFPDVYPNHGSLGGIFTAVHCAGHPYTLVVACDMPWLNRPLLEYIISLRETADVVVPRWNNYPEPLHAVYSKTCLPPIEEKLKAKRLKIIGFFGKVRVNFVNQDSITHFDPDGRSFANINTPQDLNQLRIMNNQL